MPGVTNLDGRADASPLTAAHPSVTHHLLIVALFLAALAGTCGLLHSRLPFPPVPDVGARFTYFAAHKDEFDTIFIGSSHLRHGIVPQQFDEETAKQQLATHSFNLAFSGMWPPESYYYLRQVLALHPRKLRWVFIELMDFRGQAEGEMATARSVYWHDGTHTAMAWRLVAESPGSAPQKAELFATHTWQFIQNMTNPGRGADWLEARYFPKKKKSDTSWIPRRGFDPEPEGGWAIGAKTQYRKQIEAFQRARQETPMRPGLAAALQKLAGEVEQAGARPIFIVLPTVRPEEHFAADSVAKFGELLAFDDPSQFPRLYLPELHYDSGHLNETGAREFSALLAERFAHATTTSQ